MDCEKRLICAAGDLIDGGDGVRFSIHGPQSELPAFAVRHGEKVYAYRNECAHVAVELDWNPCKFFDDSGLYLICATHGALYEPATGQCIDGPCRSASLYAVAIEEHDGNIYLKSDP